MRRFEGKSVLITGAAGGFGRRAAERFAVEGARLAIADIEEEGLRQTAALIEKAGSAVVAKRTDVSVEADVAGLVEAAVDAHGGLDVALNNAGIVHKTGRLPTISYEDFGRTMAVNAGGVFLGMKHQLPVMAEQGAGVILNVASAAGLVGAATMSAYAASKHAVVGLTRTAAEEYAGKGVRVNAICPAFAATAMIGVAAEADSEAGRVARAALTMRMPMRRVGTIDEIVQAMLWICCDENSFMTGQAIAVDGGLTAI